MKKVKKQPTQDELATMKLPKYYLTEFFRAVKEAVFARADYRCVLCNAPAKVAHHRNYGHRGDFEGEVQNCVALCMECHRQFHKPMAKAQKKLVPEKWTLKKVEGNNNENNSQRKI
jgi:5-methylcytosine-specific restriction endonuclease McrA